MQTVFGARLGRHAENVSGMPAVAMPGREITYAELIGRVQTCAAWLARQRLDPSEAVGITIAEEVPHLVANLALMWLGIPQVCLPTYDPVATRLSLADRLGVARVIVSDPRHALPGRELLLLTPALHEVGRGNAFPEPVDVDPDAPALYFTSSGTTGQPKIFALSQRGMAWRCERIAESECIGPEHRGLTLLPIEEFLSKSRVLRCAYMGLTSVFPNALSSPLLSTQELCASLRVTCLELSVLQVSSLVRDPDVRPLPEHTVVYTAGAAVPTSLRQQFKDRFGAPLVVHYGTREFGRISITLPGGSDNELETVGTPVPWIDLEIVDDHGQALPPGEMGELRVRCEQMIRGYYRDPVATSRHFKDAWFYPRDLASLTPGGALRLHGRADDMMNLNGIKIFPAEIERVLEEHPAVRAAAAFARPSAAYGDIPVAAVELRAPAMVDVDELMSCARARLGARAPRKIIVLEALPRNTAGKIARMELAALLAPGE